MDRIGKAEVAEAISDRIGSFVYEDNIAFVEVDGDTVLCWYMNSGGEGPSYEVLLTRGEGGWRLDLREYPPGVYAEDRHGHGANEIANGTGFRADA